jgi:hypothetical protein
MSEFELDGVLIDTQFEDQVVDNFNFLKDLPLLKILTICTFQEINFNFLNDLTNLKELNIIMIKYGTILNFTKLNQLLRLNITFDNIECNGLNNLSNLKELEIWSSSDKDFKRFKDLVNLKKITVKTASIKNLEGLENLQKLDEILLANCRSLRDISQLTKLQTIKKVFFNNRMLLKCLFINNF